MAGKNIRESLEKLYEKMAGKIIKKYLNNFQRKIWKNLGIIWKRKNSREISKNCWKITRKSTWVYFWEYLDKFQQKKNLEKLPEKVFRKNGGKFSKKISEKFLDFF